MTKSKFALWLVCVASLALPLTTFAQKKPTIIVVTHGTATNVFWAVAHNGVISKRWHRNEWISQSTSSNGYRDTCR